MTTMRRTHIERSRPFCPQRVGVMIVFFAALLLTVSAPRASTAASMQPAAPDTTNAGVGESRPYTGGFRLQLFSSDATHTAIEQRLGAFQEDTDLPLPLYVVLALAFGRGHNIGEVEGAWGTTKRSFLDDEHTFEVNEFYAMLWYRRLVPVIGRVRLLPGAAIGYTWPYAKVHESDSSADGAESPTNENTKILSGSGVTYAAGVELEIGLFTDAQGGLFLNLDYRYRFGPKISASTPNDGEIFFPGGSEFDFEGSYIGIGVALRWAM
jgi:hypothetical protein